MLTVNSLNDYLNQITADSELQGRLDDFVHDLKAQEASDLNNEGPLAQLQYLLGTQDLSADVVHDFIVNQLGD